VVVDVQRGSPSTGLPTMPGQSDVMQARWGSHGDYGSVAYAPWSPQEMFDLTIHCFNVADRYRLPVFLMADEVVGHMVERVVIPSPDQIQYWERKHPKAPPGGHFEPYKTEDADLVPPMVHAGEGYHIHYTGLTHDQRGYPDMTAETHHELVSRLVSKVRVNQTQLILTEGYDLQDAEILVIAYGCTSRSARRAVREARQQGIRAGLLRLISIWPFAEEKISQLAGRAKSVIVAEMNLGQMSREVERCIRRPVKGVFHAGGAMIPPEPILQAIQEEAQ
jgi:2-oxoglutarate ferredoxin oxidoreductase subunit alpha